MRENKIYSFIGLDREAGAVAMGEGLAEQAVKRGKAYLVLIADDAASNTAKKIRTAVYGRNVPLVGFGKKEQLGQILGKTFVSVIAVTDRSFAERIKELVELENNNDNSSYGGDFVEQTHGVISFVPASRMRANCRDAACGAASVPGVKLRLAGCHSNNSALGKIGGMTQQRHVNPRPENSSLNAKSLYWHWSQTGSSNSNAITYAGPASGPFPC